jgi:hypothetical protein
MIVNYWILSSALLLLFLPRQWLRLGVKFTGRSASRNLRKPLLERDALDASLKLKEEFSKVRNWIDLARAATGALAVNYACFNLEPRAETIGDNPLFALKCSLLIVAVGVQASHFKDRLQFSAPIFFILGLSFGLIGKEAALLACVSVWTVSLAIPSPATFLLVFAGLELGFGLLFALEDYPYILLAVGLAFIPTLLSRMMRRDLVKLKKPSRVRRA